MPDLPKNHPSAPFLTSPHLTARSPKSIPQPRSSPHCKDVQSWCLVQLQSSRLLCPQPSPAWLCQEGKLPASHERCCGRSRRDAEPQIAWQTPHCMTLASEVRGVKGLACQRWKSNTKPSRLPSILNEERNCWENMENNGKQNNKNMENNIGLSPCSASMLLCGAPA